MMKSKIQDLFKREFDICCKSHKDNKYLIACNMTGYADALYDLDLISSEEFHRVYKDILEYIKGDEE